MTQDDLAVATMTRVTDPAEQPLVQSALTRLAAFGMPVAVADGGSAAPFLASMRGVSGLAVSTTDSTSGLVGQVRASLAAAAATGRRFVLYTEPDKDVFFHTHLHEFIARAPEPPPPGGLVLAARNPAAFDTFPAFQRLTEDTLNRLCAELTGIAGDYCYGPFIVSRELVSRVAAVPPEIGWGWRPYLFAVAHRLTGHLRHVEGPYRCPPEQAGDSAGERVHRMRQLVQNINGLILSTT